jgi:hypothetical protein
MHTQAHRGVRRDDEGRGADREAARRGALPLVRCPERQWKITALAPFVSIDDSRESAWWRAPGTRSRACSSCSRMSTRIAPSSISRLASATSMIGNVMTVYSPLPLPIRLLRF